MESELMSMRAPTTEHRLRALSRRMHAPHWIIVGFALCILLAVLNELYERLSVLAFLVPRFADNSPGVSRLISTEIWTLVAHMALYMLLCILGYIYIARQNQGVDYAMWTIAGSKVRREKAMKRPAPLQVSFIRTGHYEVKDGDIPYQVWLGPHTTACQCEKKSCQHVAAVKREQQHRRLKTVTLVPEQKKASG